MWSKISTKNAATAIEQESHSTTSWSLDKVVGTTSSEEFKAIFLSSGYQRSLIETTCIKNANRLTVVKEVDEGL